MSSSLGVKMTSLFSTLLILRHLTAATVKLVLIQKEPWRWKCLTASLSYPNEKSGCFLSLSFLSTSVQTSFNLLFNFFVTVSSPIIQPQDFFSSAVSDSDGIFCSVTYTHTKGANSLIWMVKVPCFGVVDIIWEEENSLNLIFVLQKDSLLSEYINLHN